MNDDFLEALDVMTKGISSVREVIQGLVQQCGMLILTSQDSQFLIFFYSTDLETKDGISLLSLKNHLLLSYIQSLSLLTAHRVLGHSLTMRSRPSKPFTATDRDSRGSNAGDLVDTLVEDRIILEKVKQLESKMRYQIEKLVRISQDDATRTEADVVNGKLHFQYIYPGTSLNKSM